MKSWKLISIAVGAVGAFSMGWVGAEVRNADKLPLGSVISNAWIERVTLLTDAEGKERSPEGVMEAVELSMESLSTALESYYEDLPDEEKKKLAPYVDRAHSAASLNGRAATMRVAECIEKAGLGVDVKFRCDV